MAHAINRFVANTRIAHFSMEVALRNEVHTYAGGLGVLAGDTARSCADMQIPVVFVTLAVAWGTSVRRSTTGDVRLIEAILGNQAIGPHR